MSENKKRESIAILGGGVTGVCLAKALSKTDKFDIHLFEKKSVLGGLLKSFHIGGNIIDIGPYFFPVNWKFFKWFPDTMAFFQYHSPVIKTITPKFSLDNYPITPKQYIKDNGIFSCLHAGFDLIRAKFNGRYLESSAAFAEHWIGKKMFISSGLYNYIERVFHASPYEISSQFALMRMISLEQISVKKYLERTFKKSGNTGYSGKVIRLPFMGYDNIFQLIKSELENSGVHIYLETPVSEIHKQNGKWKIYSKNMEYSHYDHIFTTLPPPQISSNNRINFSKSALPILNLATLVFSHSNHKPFSVLYNHSFTGKWKRLTNFTFLYPELGKRDIYAVEFTISPEKKVEMTTLLDNFIDTGREMKFLDGKVEYLGYFITENSYPVIKSDAESAIQSIRNEMDSMSIYHIGRNGNFEYLNSLECLNRIDEFMENFPPR
jgi:hypothetical protein